MTLEFRSNADKVVANINKKSRDMGRQAQKLMDKLGADWEREMVLGQFSGYYQGATVGNKLRNRSGNLKSSIRFKSLGGSTIGEAGVLVMAGSAAAGYAKLQETGKPRPLKPKRRRYLRIPLPGAMTGSGVVRAENKPMKSGSGWRTAGGKKTFVRENNGKAIVYRKDGGDRITPLFLLKASVRVKPRLGMERTLKKVMKRELPHIASSLAKTLTRRR